MSAPRQIPEGETPPSRWIRRIILATLLIGAFIIALTPVSDGDIFWHLAAGREMVRRHAWLRTDPFTLSAAGRPWVDVHWLFQLGAFAVFQGAGGLAGVVAVKALLIASGAIVLARTVERSQGILGLVLCTSGLLAALFLARHLLLARPVVVTLTMLALFFAVLESCRSGTRRALLWLPLLQIVWVNCQGLAVLGPILVAAYLIDAVRGYADDGTTSSRPSRANPSNLGLPPRRALAATLGLCALALMASPYGWHSLTLPGGLFMRVVPGARNIFSAQIAENVPPWMLARTAPAETAHLAWVLGAMVVCLMVARRGFTLSGLLLLGAFSALALMANRNVLLLYWLAPPIVSIAIAPRLRGWILRLIGAGTAQGFSRLRGVGWTLVSLLLGGQVALAAVATSREGGTGAPVAFHFPVESAKKLRALGASGAVFAPDHQGGYLEWTVPRLQPYIDTRLVLHTADEYAKYLAAVDDPDTFDALDDAQHFRYVVLTTSYPDRYLGLAQYLATNPSWQLIFTDGSEVLFAREGVSVSLGSRDATNAILHDLTERFSDSPTLSEAARLNLARLLVVCGETREAQVALSTLHSRAAAQMRARAYFAAGEPAAAEGLARTLIESDARDIRSLALLAQIAIVRGQAASGADWLRRALTVDPFDPEANAVLEKMERSAPSAARALP